MAYTERRSSDANSVGLAAVGTVAVPEDLLSKLSRLTSRLHGLRFATKAIVEKVEGYYNEAEDSKLATEVSTTAHGYANEALDYLGDIERMVERLHSSLGERPLPPQPSQPSSR